MNALAMMGAKARLEQLQAEAEEIRRMFPDLSASDTGRVRARAATNSARSGRKPMSAAEKRAVSTRMTKYWAGRRQAKAKAAGAPETAAPAAEAPKRTISAEGRARIAEAQKKRWDAARKAAKPAQESAAAGSGETAAPAQRGGPKRGAGKRGATKRQAATAAAAR